VIGDGVVEFRSVEIPRRLATTVIVVLSGSGAENRGHHDKRAKSTRKAARRLFLTSLCVIALWSGAVVGKLGSRQPQPADWAAGPDQPRVIPAWKAPQQDWPLAVAPARRAPE